MSDSDSDLEVVKPLKPLPKRRRIIDPSTIASVPIYSNKVNTCLQLKPSAAVLAETEKNTGDSAEASVWSQSPPKEPVSLSLSDSEEEEAETVQKKSEEPEDVRSPSPPPPPTGSPAAKVSSRVSRKIHEINRQLGAVSSLLSPSPETGGRRFRRGRRTRSAPLEEQEEEEQYGNDSDDDDDIIIVTPGAGPRGSPSAREGSPLTAREIPLKVRCRTDLHKIPVLSSAPLSKVVDELSVKLQVPPSRILLLRKEIELSTHLTANELGLGIADIIDCVVMAADDKQSRERAVDDNSNVITVRLQGKEKGSTQEYSLHREAPLGSVLSQYLSRVSGGARHKVQFFFDGSKITHSQTPADLDMEDGDVIEVWT